MKSIFIDCSLGISGDMLASALFDLGVPQSVYADNLLSLKMDKNYKIVPEKTFSEYSLQGLAFIRRSGGRRGGEH